MSIQVRCPQCQKAYAFPDDKRGKQVRCQDCFQVFFAGDAPTDAAPEAASPPEPLPAPPPKPVAKSTPTPPTTAATRPAPKPGPKTTPKTPPPAPRTRAAAPSRPSAPRRRRKSGMGIGTLLIVFLLLFLVGGGSAAAVVLAFKDKLPFLAATTPTPSHPADPNPPPKPDNNDPPKPDSPDKPAEPATGKLAVLSQENFDKIARGTPADALTSLLGPPTFTQDSKQAGAEKDLVWRVGGVGPRVTVSLRGGRVVAKASGQDWPVVYPADVVVNPPPDNPPKPGQAVTRENFDKIDKGMTPDQLKALLGPPTDTINLNQPNFDVRLGWTTDLTSMYAFLKNGKVVGKDSSPRWPIAYPSDVAGNPPPPPDKPKPAATQASFDKIDKGMSEKDVTDLLGPIAQSRPSLTRPGDEEKVWAGVDGTLIVVTLHNMRGGGAVVVGKSSSAANWPIVWPGDVAKNPPPDKPPPPPPLETKVVTGKVTKIDHDGIVINATIQGDDGKESSWGISTAKVTIDGKEAKPADLKSGSTVTLTSMGVDLKIEAKAPAAPPPPDKPDPAKFAMAVNQDNFDKIAKGMTKDALTDLFGPPSDVKPQPQPGVDERLTWQGNGSKIMVSVAGGKVVSKLTTADWPVVYPK